MTVISIYGLNKKTGKQRTVIHAIQELLDCICDTRKEYIDYVLAEAQSVAEENNLKFTGFKIIAE